MHCGGLHQPHIKHLSNDDFVAINIQGTLNLLELAKEHMVSSFVYTSTTSVFGHALKTPGAFPSYNFPALANLGLWREILRYLKTNIER